MQTVVLTVLAYCLVAFIAFGDALAPFGILFWSDRLGMPLWKLFVLGSVLLSGAVFFVPCSRVYKVPAFVLLTMTLSIGSVGLYADQLRRDRSAEFAPDAIDDHSFFRSIREAPREPQFYLHAAALKNCVPYGWSYRTMDFYELPTNVAVNVLPRDWLERCKIRRT